MEKGLLAPSALQEILGPFRGAWVPGTHELRDALVHLSTPRSSVGQIFLGVPRGRLSLRLTSQTFPVYQTLGGELLPHPDGSQLPLARYH